MLSQEILHSIKNIFINDKNKYHDEFLYSSKLHSLFKDVEGSLEKNDSSLFKNLIVLSTQKIKSKSMCLESMELWPFDNIESYNLPSLEKLITEIDNYWLSAKFYDYLWSTANVKGTSNAKKMLMAYQKFPIENLLHDLAYWERALSLSSWANEVQEKNNIVELLVSFARQDGFAFIVARLLFKQGNKIFSIYSLELTKLVIKEVDSLIKDENFSIATKYWELLLNISKKNLPSELDRNNIRHSYSKVYYQWAFQERERNNHTIAGKHFRSALFLLEELDNKYKQVNEINQFVQGIEEELVKTRKDIIEQFQKTSYVTTSDLTQVVEDAKQFAYGKPFESIINCQTLHLLNIRAGYFDSLKRNCLSTVFFGSESFTDEDGKFIGNYKVHSAESRNAHMMRSYKQACEMTVVGHILPMLSVFKSQQDLDKTYFSNLVKNSALISSSQQSLVTRALWFGYKEDFSTALMLICPLIESTLRNILKESDIPTVTINTACEGEKSLSLLLRLAKNKRILDSFVKFEVEALFSDKHGFNFRNKIAHGLIDDQTSQPYGAIFVWWWFLKAVMLYQILDE
ncbi:DUF4209 domain-containing protein [Aliivibrio fischeri]|uniref:DUF4209 domain-containing protein n=1 Tax=Aliivibrio fischeri TaxID=668 RepID=UPI0012D94293|nr:DUF4209 domain-containing protein [Aliivibrio fischeri]MUK77726.1 DUF4209 domain-containing protein [Aliivibrio fischeri]